MREEIRPGSPFQEGCVLQQGDQTRIWGYAAAGEKILVEIQNQKKEYLTDDHGRFEGFLPCLTPGGPFSLTLCGEKGESLTITDVYVGEVVICAGQSNAGLSMSRVREQYPEEFHQGGAPHVHIYKVEETYEFHEPLFFHENARWISCTVDKLSDLSALSYFTGKKLWEDRKVPVGILNLSIGGTPAEAWISQEGLAAWPEYLAYRGQYEDDEWRSRYMEDKRGQEAAWQAELASQEKEASKGSGTLRIPGYLSESGLIDFCGCLWLYKTFYMPEDFDGRPGLLRFGTLTDNDEIFINGIKVGETGYSYPPRRYPIASGIILPGKNEVRIRLVVRDGRGRVTYGKPYDIIWEDVCDRIPADVAGAAENHTHADLDSTVIERILQKRTEKIFSPVSLTGDWYYEIRAISGPAPEQEFLIRKPTVLFQGMTAPCIPYTVRGVIWYQGESNDQDSESYMELLPAMICDWRHKWNQEHLPFIIIQLPNCAVDTAPGEAWPKIREAQRQSGKLEDTAVITTLDLGEDNDLHPLRKKELSERAVLALDTMVYGEKKHFQGPVPEQVTWSDGVVKITFCSADISYYKNWHLQLTQGREIPDGLFEWMDQKGNVYPASATLYPSEKKVILSKLMKKAETGTMDVRTSLSVCDTKSATNSDAMPVAIRYAYQAAPGPVLLTDETGIPASPFVELVQPASSADYLRESVQPVWPATLFRKSNQTGILEELYGQSLQEGKQDE